MIIALFALLIPYLITASKYSGLDGRIVNGPAISSNQYPWMVSLRGDVTRISENGTNETSSFQNCGAQLIGVSPPTILTAAHCVDGIFDWDTNTTFYKWFADVNRTYETLSFPNDTYYTFPIYKNLIHLHPDWGWSPYGGHDIALFISNESFTEAVQNKLKPYLPTVSSVVPCCESHEDITIIGYGGVVSPGNGSFDLYDSKVLRRTNMRYVNKVDCGQQLADLLKQATLVNGSLPENLTEIDGAFGVEIDASEVTTIEELDEVLNEYIETTNIYENRLICISGNDTDACYGDSGGPLFKSSDDPMDIKLLGIMSFFPDGICSSNLFTAYTDIGSYYEWIVNVTGITAQPSPAPSPQPSAEPSSEPSPAPTTELIKESTKMPETNGATGWIINWMILCVTLLYISSL